jgi:DNA-binding LacI/PurR family transcriptional regulator
MFRYAQIAQELRERIVRGEYATGRLPAERALGQEFGVQRDTIRQALEVLTQQRVLLRDSTRGTYLSPEYVRGNVVVEETVSEGRALLIVPAFDNTLAPSLVLQGLTQQMESARMPVSWYDSGFWNAPRSDDKPYLPSRLLREKQNIQGAIFWASFPTSVPELQALQADIPLVLIDRKVPGLEADFVGFQDREGGRSITEHLLRLGHRRIGFASGEPQASTVQARRAGYVDALKSAGIIPDPYLELHQQGGTYRLTHERVDAFLSPVGGPLTAVVCANDVVAAHMIQHVHRRRQQVPEDVAITGFGDLSPSMMEAFGITTVSQPFKEMGRKAGELLLLRLNGESVGMPAKEVLLPLEIIIRRSCGSLK